MRASVIGDRRSAVDALNVRHTIIIISILYSRRHAHPKIDIGSGTRGPEAEEASNGVATATNLSPLPAPDSRIQNVLAAARNQQAVIGCVR